MEERTRLKRGFSLTELLTVIAIIAVLAAIAIPAISAIRNALEFRRLNDTAKAVYMAAQSNMVEMRASGEIKQLKEDASLSVPALGAYPISSDSSQNANFAGWLAEYFYTTSRFPDSGNANSAFSLILPASSVDSTVRSGNILIEYNPYAASVYSVFYTEREDIELADTKMNYHVQRDEAWRKANKVGYYNGSTQESPNGDIYTDEEVFASVTLENGEEAFIVASVPIPAAYMSSPTTFMQNLNASAVVTGEQFGGSFTLPEDAFRENKSISLDGRSIELRASVDSLRDGGSFAGLPENNAAATRAAVRTGRSITEIKSESDMKILPGQNVVIEAVFSYDTSGGDFFAAPASVTSEPVNPMFADLVTTAEDTYILHVANGRNLQNLNLVSPQVAAKVVEVAVDNDIYWNETTAYYNGYANRAEEVPGRCLPYFVPITNSTLFGSAIFHADTGLFLSIGTAKSNLLPAMDDYEDIAKHAVFEGNGNRICYINVNAQDARMQFAGPSGKTESALGREYYAGVPTKTVRYNDRDKLFDATTTAKTRQPDAYSGLFSYANTTIQNVNVVNPTIRGIMLERVDSREPGLGFPAAGCLVGAAGWNSYLYNCHAYIDPTAPYFNRANLRNYGVTGYGAVGGLVGYSKSHRTLSDGILDFQADHLAFHNSSASVYVVGEMYDATKTKGVGNDYLMGYCSGVGGLVGVSVLSNYYNCYSGSTVTGTNFYFQTEAKDARDRGVGGFVGTCRGTRYTNCFATGDVVGVKLKNGDRIPILTNKESGQFNNLGTGGFAGVVYNNESYTYDENILSDAIKDLFRRNSYQYSQFNDCYCLGSIRLLKRGKSLSGSGGTYLAGFAGLHRPGAEEGIRYAAPDKDTDLNYYTAADKFKSKNYLYKNVYYVNSWGNPDDWTPGEVDVGNGAQYFRTVGEGINYEKFTNLSANTRPGAFSGWKNLTASQTHSFDATGAYPFSVPNNQSSFYGSWPVRKLNAYVGYYEMYQGGGMGVYAFGEEFSTLQNDKTVLSDGYCVLAANGKSTIEVQVEGQSNWVKVNKESTNVKVRNDEFVVYRLPASVEEAVLKLNLSTSGTAAQKFYSHITVREAAGATQYHMYYNPRFAMAQLMHVNDNTGTVGNWNEVDLPDSVSIRTARQVYELGQAPRFWGESYNYVQELNVDADSYRWSDVFYTNKKANEKPVFSPIGASDIPFEGTYNGGLGYVTQAELKGFDIVARADGNYGIFGVIGKLGSAKPTEAAEAAEAAETADASAAADADVKALAKSSRVENLTITGRRVDFKSAALNNVGLLCGVNNGTVNNITVKNNTTIDGTALTNTGLIAGSNTGVIAGSAITADAVAMDGKNVGSAVGTNSGSARVDVTIGEFTGKSFVNGGAVGGVIGSQTAGSLNGIFAINKVNGQVSDASFDCAVGGIFGQFSGTLDSGSAELDSVSSTYGTAAGIAGAVKDGKVSGYTVKVGTVSGGKGAAGAFGKVERLIGENIQAAVTKSVTSANGNAAGFALELGGSTHLENCSVELGGSVKAEEKNAAGFVIHSEAELVDSSVYLGAPGGTEVKIEAPKGTAVGFGVELSKTADSCGVSGVGAITGGVDAAGFAGKVTGAVSGSYVTPASLHTDNKRAAYRAANAGQLKITAAKRAAGFALDVDTKGSILSSYALGTVSGETAAGFLAENSGTIRRAQANVTLGTSGSGFVASNKGTIDAAYVWYDGTAANGFAAENTGKINGCYAAPLHQDAENLFAPADNGCKDCFGVTGQAAAADSGMSGIAYKTVSEMTEVDVAVLDRNTTGINWQYSAVKQYPYSSALVFKPYMLPSLAQMNQYGDWVDTYGGSDIAYGILYYEVDRLDNYYVGTMQLVNRGLLPADAGDRIHRELKSLEDMKEPCVSYGYAVFTNDPASLEEIVGNDFIDFEHPVAKINNAFLDSYGMYSYPVTEVKDAKPLTVIDGVFNPYYADAIWLNGEAADNPYRVRAAKQLENVAKFPASRFSLEVDVDYSTLQKIPSFSGILEGNNHVITGLHVPLFGEIKSGSGETWVSGLKINGDRDQPVIETLSGGAVKNITVNGNLTAGFVGNVGGTLANVTVNGNLTKGFAGNVSGALSNITVNGTVSGTNLLGSISGTVDGLELDDVQKPISGTVAKGAEVKNVTVDAYSTDSGLGLFGTLDGKLEEIHVKNAALTATASGAVNWGILVNTANKGAEIVKVQIDNAAMSITNSTSGAKNVEQNYGAVVGLAKGTKIDKATVGKETSGGLVLKVSESKDKGSILMSFGGLVGKAVKADDTVTDIRNSKVYFRNQAENVTLSVDSANNASGTLNLGGLVGSCQAVVTNSSVEGMSLKKGGYSSSSSDRPALDLNIGGLVGSMANGAALYGSHAGVTGKPIVFAVEDPYHRSTKGTYNLGGAVGADVSDSSGERARYGRMSEDVLTAYLQTDETYSNSAVYAVSNISYTKEKNQTINLNAGQFIGKVTNGIFDACEGWGNTAHEFAGELKPAASTMLKGVLVSDKMEAPASGMTQYGADYVLKDVVMEDYESNISRCTFSGSDGKTHRLDIAGQYLYNVETVDLSSTTYTVQKMNGTSDASASNSYMLAAFSGGKGYALATDRSSISTYALPDTVKESQDTIIVTERANGKSVIWKNSGSNAFADLYIGDNALSYSPNEKAVTIGRNGSNYYLYSYRFALKNAYHNVIFQNGQFGVKSNTASNYKKDAVAMFRNLYRVIKTEENKQTWFTYERNASVISKELLNVPVTAPFDCGNSTALDLIALTTEGLPEVVKQYPTVDTNPTFGEDALNMNSSAEDVTEETVPETTDPEETTPETTEPTETVPETTEPSETVPEVTEPEQTEPTETDPTETNPDPSEAPAVSEAAEPPKQETIPVPDEEERS